MLKHSADLSPDLRPTKQQKTDSEAQRELDDLPDRCLPDPGRLAALNRDIIAEMNRTLPNGIGRLTDGYSIVQAHCGNLLQPANRVDFKWLLNNAKVLHELLSEAYRIGDFKRIMLISQLRVSESLPRIEASAPLASQASATREAWTTPFIGKSHDALLANLRRMYTRSLGGKDENCRYLCHTSIIQSSGSGKSRMVDEVSKAVFAIPLNIRMVEDSKDGAWPLPDDAIRELLVRIGTVSDEKQMTRRFLCFFQALFDIVADTVQRACAQSCRSREDFATFWRDYLSNENRRTEMYKHVVLQTDVLLSKVHELEQDVRILVQGKVKLGPPSSRVVHKEQASNESLVALAPEAGSDTMTSTRTITVEQQQDEIRSRITQALEDLETHDRLIKSKTRAKLRNLVSLVCRLSRCSISGDPVQETPPASPPSVDDSLRDSGTDPVRCLHVLIYLDEAHVLAALPALKDVDKLPLDILIQALDDFQHCGAFTVLMSTQSHIQYLAPSSSFARSARYRDLVGDMQAPITETPFDCFGPHKLIPSRLKADDVGKVALMACFGRPMWRAMLSPYPDHALAEYTNTVGPTVTSCSDDHDSASRSGREETLLAFARAKLLCSDKLTGRMDNYPPAAKTAVIDARIMLPYEASRPSAQRYQMDLVASHMRTVYSIPRDREYLRSGYSSEPILAEAAARQLATWRELEKNDRERPLIEPAVAILRDNLEHDLLARSEIGDAVGRLLLLLAHDNAARTSSDSKQTHYSRPISVEVFIRALLPETIAEHVLDSVPDNQVRGEGTKTLREVFKDAVLNFTHFAKWADDSALTEDSALGCFIRHMAVICRNNGALVDAFLPILMDRSAPLNPGVMSGIFIQFKLRRQAGTAAAYAINEEKIGFFSPGGTSRPYITLIMELGVTNPVPLLARTPANYHSSTAERERAQIARQRDPTSSSIVPESPSKITVPDGPVRGHSKSVHPRYSMYVHGCSPTVYNVIGEHERAIYKQIIRTGDLLGEHPRQNPESLALVRNQKPFFALGNTSWHWIQNEVLNVDEPRADDDTADVVFCGNEIAGEVGKTSESETGTDDNL